MNFWLSGKRPLSMPSSRGLGLGCAEMLCAKGVRVLLTGRSADKLAETANAITAKGPGSADTAVCDLTEKAAFPGGRYGTVAKFASVCAFLRSPKQAMSPGG